VWTVTPQLSFNQSFLSSDFISSIPSTLSLPFFLTSFPSSLPHQPQDMEAGGQYSAALVVYLSSKTSSFKISNINIMKAVIQTACQAAKHTGTGAFSKPAAWELIKNFGNALVSLSR
jgi:hypothetical protein